MPQTGRPVESFGDDGVVDLRDVARSGRRLGHEPDRHELAADDRERRRHRAAPRTRRSRRPDQAEERDRLHPRLRRRDGQAAVDVPHDPAARRAGLRDLARRLGARRARGNAGVWATISADEQLGLAYLPVESPYGDMYGGLRPGANLYGESIVAVDLQHRRAPLALSDVASSAVGLRHSDRADPRRRREGRHARSRRSRRRRSRACCSC